MKIAVAFVAIILSAVLASAQDDDEEWEELEYNGGGFATEEDEDAWLARQHAAAEQSLQKEWSEHAGWTDANGKESTGPKPRIEFLRPKPGDKIYDENVIVEFFVHDVDPASGVSAILYLGNGNPTRIQDFRNSIHVTVTQLRPGTHTMGVVLVDKHRNPMNIESAITFEKATNVPMTIDQMHERAARDNFLDTRVYEVTIRYYSAQSRPDSLLDQAEKLVLNALAGDKTVLDSNRNSTQPSSQPMPEEANEEESLMAQETEKILNPTNNMLERRQKEDAEKKQNGVGDEEEGVVRKVAKPFKEGADQEIGNDLSTEREKTAEELEEEMLNAIQDQQAQLRRQSLAQIRESPQTQSHLLFVQGALQLFNREKRDVRSALPLLSQAASLGSSNAHLFLAVLWTIGDEEVGGKIDEAAALYHFEKCADANHPLCKQALGYRYMHGFGGVNKSCETAALNYRLAAEMTLMFTTENAGFAPLHKTRLSEFREIQQEEQNDEIESFEEFKAEQGGEGSKEAHLFLGLHKYFGTGKSEGDRAQALEHFEEAAEQGSGMASNNLGTIYMNGVGVEKNDTRAYELFEKAAALGDHWGVNSLAVCHWNGISVPANKTEGLRLYRLAAAMGNPAAAFNLGNFYREGSKGLKRDYTKALEFLNFAARHGQADALLAIGLMHLSGEGIEPSCPTALNCFKQAAEHGPWGATLQEAYRAFKNNDITGAFFRYAIAAESGYSVAQANVGWLHENGYGRGALDPKAAALDMYSLAAEQGDIPSLRKMGDMHFHGHTTQGIDYESAALYYSKAKDHDDHALFNLAYMHEHGLGVPLDAKIALELYTTLADAEFDGSLPSQMAITRMQVVQLLQSSGLISTDVSSKDVEYLLGAAAAVTFVSIVVLAICVFR